MKTKTISILGTFFFMAWEEYYFFFRFFSMYGVKANKNHLSLSFSERNGFEKTYKIFGWVITILK